MSSLKIEQTNVITSIVDILKTELTSVISSAAREYGESWQKGVASTAANRKQLVSSLMISFITIQTNLDAILSYQNIAELLPDSMKSYYCYSHIKDKWLHLQRSIGFLESHLTDIQGQPSGEEAIDFLASAIEFCREANSRVQFCVNYTTALMQQNPITAR